MGDIRVGGDSGGFRKKMKLFRIFVIYLKYKHMKIAFDAKRITHNATGLGNYSRFVVNGLSAFYPEHTYQLYTPSKGKEALSKRIESRPNVSFHYPEGRFDKLLPSVWRSSGITTTLRKEKVDLFHGLSNEIPANLKQNGIPSVVTIHDLIFLRYPKLYKPIDRSIYTYKFKQACLRSDRILAISQQTKRDIRDFFGIPEEKIEVVYQGCDPVFGQAVTESMKLSVREKYQIDGPYILYVGSIEERKNLLLLVKALKGLHEDISVIAIGKRTPYTDTVESYIRENNLSARVRILSNIPFSELPAFYQMATLFVYPSFFEGFGIPILEAQLAGIPVIAAAGSCLEEAGGPSALYTDPRSEQELRGLIESVLNDPKLAESMQTHGRTYTQRFAPGTLATQLMQLYKNISQL